MLRSSPGVRLALFLLILLPSAARAVDDPAALAAHPIWFWPLLLFLFCLVLGILAVLAGVGGGVLYVPLVDALFPFHLDFVRGTGLLIALAGSLSTAPQLLRRRLTSLHLTVPAALMVSVGAILGARLGLAIPRYLVEILLGVTVIMVAILMFKRGRGDEGDEEHPYGPVAQWFRMTGSYLEASTGEQVEWHAWRVRYALPAAFGIGVLGGMFGVGSGWANVPMFNLLMGIPLKIATASSVFMISIGSVSAAWIYWHKGSILAFMAAPSILGLMLGSQIGARLLDRAKPQVIRRIVLVVLAFAGLRSLIHGLMSVGGGG